MFFLENEKMLWICISIFLKSIILTFNNQQLNVRAIKDIFKKFKNQNILT